jgi:16S rRNA (cytosine1407-C5)-methyltransferase
LGSLDFESYYHNIYGSRWPPLRESLLAPPASIAYTEGLKKPYVLDRASVLAALSLKLPESGIILDSCAAPGGKSLVIASRMGKAAELLSNELSSSRRRRLAGVLDGHLDRETRSRVKVSGFDAAGLGRRKNEWGRFASVLLDVPCSSERHVLKNEKALEAWTPARPRFLARRQWSLLSAAFLLLKPGGSLVYAACALSDEENDAVVSRLFSKYGEEVVQDEPGFTEGEKTRYGRLILPDTCQGMGPMYVAVFLKRETGTLTACCTCRFFRHFVPKKPR